MSVLWGRFQARAGGWPVMAVSRVCAPHLGGPCVSVARTPERLPFTSEKTAPPLTKPPDVARDPHLFTGPRCNSVERKPLSPESHTGVPKFFLGGPPPSIPIIREKITSFLECTPSPRRRHKYGEMPSPTVRSCE